MPADVLEMDPILKATRDERAALQTQLDELLAKPVADKRSLTDVEETSFEELSKKIAKRDKQIVKLEAEGVRRAAAALAQAEIPPAPAGGAFVRREAGTYRQHADLRRGDASFMVDLAVIAAASQRLGGYSTDPDRALARLHQNSKEFEVDTRADARRERFEFEQRISGMGGSAVESRVAPNTTTGTGGEFVPPLWMVSSYMPYMRFTRVAANRVRNLPLPPGIDVINIPKITLGSLTAVQAANAAAVASRDITTATVSAAVRTIAGQQDISLQLLEQSPLAMDGVVFDDLSADYDLQLDQQVIFGSGANGQHLGVLNVTSAATNTDITKANAVTVASAVFHDAATAATQYRSVINGVTQIETLRISPPTGIWVHPRRANSWAFASDTTNRPLFVPARYGPLNALGQVESGGPIPQGIAGELFGLPVVKDGNMPTTMNGTATTGGTADPIIVAKEDDLYLWEGTLRMRALPEILSGTLQIRFQVYAYSAFMPNRFPPSISQLTGNTGLAAPGF